MTPNTFFQDSASVHIKVDTDALRKGLYVAELDRPWLESPFLFQGFPINSDEDLQQLREVCRYVFVDPERSDAEAIRKLPARPAATTVLAVEKPAAPKIDSSVRDYREGLVVAHQLREDTHVFIRQAMEDARLGHSIDTPSARRLVSSLTHKVVHNANALMWLTQLKNQDEYTSIHSLNVSILSIAFGHFLGLDEEQLNVLGLGALLHDLGKMRIDPEILNKPARLTPVEFEHMKQHPQLGYELLRRDDSLPQEVLQIALSHHERNNGSGYTTGTQSAGIPYFVKLVSIVDVYDAISSDRCYHQGVSPQETLGIIYKMAPNEFDTDVVQAFIQCVGVYPIGCVVELTTGEVGVLVGNNPAQRLKPQVLLVTDANKQMRPVHTLVNLASRSWEGVPNAPMVARVLTAGSHGVDPTRILRELVNIE